MITMTDSDLVFLNTQEACQRLGVTPPTLNKWVRELGIRKYRSVGHTIQYREQDIERIYREKVAPKPIDNSER